MKDLSFDSKIRNANKKVHKHNVQSALYETVKLFRDATGLKVNEPLTYSEWLTLPDSIKSAALYVMFFDQITLAHYKSRSFYSLEEDNVSIVCQYLEKNVPIIIQNPRRYSPKYIYQIAYNCMYCQSRDIKRDLLRYENEVGNITIKDDTEYDMFDFISDSRTIDGMISNEDFWTIVEKRDDTALSVVENILNGTRLPAGVKAKKAAIIEELRKDLIQFVD